MNDNENALFESYEVEDEQLDFDALETQLEVDLEGQMAELELLKADREKIANPESLGSTVMNVVWSLLNALILTCSSVNVIPHSSVITLKLSITVFNTLGLLNSNRINIIPPFLL